MASRNKTGTAPRRSATTAKRHVSKVRRIAQSLSEQLGERKYDKWFSHAQFEINNQQLRVSTGSTYVKNWIDSNFSEVLEDAARAEIGDTATVIVELETDDSVSAKTTGAEAAGRKRRSARADDSDERGRSTQRSSTSRSRRSGRSRSSATGSNDSGRSSELKRLEDFVTGTCNELASAGAWNLADSDEPNSMSPFFVHSACGLGKTHLLQGVCRRHIERTGRSHRARYMTGEQFTNEYIASVKTGSVETFRNRMRRLEMLVIDDVRFLANKMRTQSELLYTLDELDMKGARVALSSDLHPRKIRGLRQPLVSRFLSGMVVSLDRPDRETRQQLVSKLAERRGLQLNDAALQAIAGQCLASVREMEGALTNLRALRDLTGGDGEIGLMLVQQVFEEDAWQPTNPVRIATVIDAVCDQLSVSRAELIGSRRNRQVVTARGLVAYLGRELTSHSYPEIAQEMGRKYHSTVHTAAQRLKRQLREDETVQLGRGEPPMRVQELVDQIRHSIMRGGNTSGVRRHLHSSDRVH